jgi:L-threonylcarbamoyladenylate synthase
MRIDLDRAAALLKSGVVAIPTETVYGLAASLHSPAAIEQLFVLKGRPRKNPLIIHVASLAEVKELATALPPDFEKLAALWPGPLTLILKADTKLIPSQVRAGLPTAAFRIPALPLARELLKKTGPLVAPSANLSGRPSSTEPKHVEEDFGKSFPVLDGGPCQKGLESTILSYGGPEAHPAWRILRQGALPLETLTQVLGYPPEIVIPEAGQNPECPGQLFRHYAPKATLTLQGNAEVILGFKERTYDLPVLLLGSLANAEEVAHNLYFVLRELDERGIQKARVDLDLPPHGLWLTLRERLLKALQKG